MKNYKSKYIPTYREIQEHIKQLREEFKLKPEKSYNDYLDMAISRGEKQAIDYRNYMENKKNCRSKYSFWSEYGE